MSLTKGGSTSRCGDGCRPAPFNGSPKNRRRALLLVAALPLLFAVSAMLGPSGVGLPDTASVSGRAILDLRLGRFFMGMLVGAALSTSGTVFQAILRNPLAEPYVLGVSGGAGLGAALSILVGGAFIGAIGLPLTAFAFALLTLLVVYAIANQGGVPSVYSLILSGVIVSAICSSVIMFLVSTADIEGMHTVVWWMLGNLQPASWAEQFVSLAFILAAIVGLWLFAPALNVLTLGREMAHYQGLDAGFVTISSLLLSTLLAATAVSMGGMIGFVGLIVPHVMRSIFGPDHRWLIPASAIGGGAFLVLCDALARTIMAPVEIPVGVVTALAGGPFFLIVLRKKMKYAWTD
ncbi:iron ABC transporter permease [Chlorobaculum sp. 24CR]|uniref:FecCD family ABC transporter permease n=1 Tax=Chlorobaculum sp. 24CR TaxID=2508878 RepID=UPI00100B23E1|nr:iron ABC transporter permease [Chlorobaculum sp. 24CR]RXK88353.1 iron ABC transporter permease [Chlorobaculum sp. 24CR]